MNLSGPNEESISGINIAPLVDVVLVLLIIFMATAPLIHHRAINVNVPRAAHSEPKATETLKVVLNEKGELHMGDKPIAVEELPFQLSAMVRLTRVCMCRWRTTHTVRSGGRDFGHCEGAGVKKSRSKCGPTVYHRRKMKQSNSAERKKKNFSASPSYFHCFFTRRF